MKWSYINDIWHNETFSKLNMLEKLFITTTLTIPEANKPYKISKDKLAYYLNTPIEDVHILCSDLSGKFPERYEYDGAELKVKTMDFLGFINRIKFKSGRVETKYDGKPVDITKFTIKDGVLHKIRNGVIVKLTRKEAGNLVRYASSALEFAKLNNVNLLNKKSISGANDILKIGQDLRFACDSPTTYIAFDRSTLLYKIGRSKTPEKRENTLRPENPDMVLIFYGANNVENYLHRKFKSQRVRGEWFNLSKDQVLECVEIIKSGIQ